MTSPEDPFMKAANYTWLYPEPYDWAEAFDYACQCKDCWRPVLKARNQWLGGILDPTDQHPGSSAILIFYRWFLLKNLFESKVVDKYDYFIVTRSDYYYVKPSPRMPPYMNPNHIWIPEGEDYGGITDRHIVVSRKHVYAALNLMEPIIKDPNGLLKEMEGYQEWNLERYIKFRFEKQGILRHVRRFPRIMYAVRTSNTSTRWSYGFWIEEAGMLVKYMTEYNDAKNSTPLAELY
ncbi:hypothetical protein GPECTOR_11g191 [Gonium pectorale]|uniref:Uncharacterized protein n=1 Tax=Gonium pectorale TaxID=33097 RepID=A0A150GPL5_GONPE|nr:hypothetical protein GPECTOR_11g191 [Gonium pectorale]|eukprot:KXZ51745.1 hypothetical protein GPECTOR_11g191 [Gonium pectorale]